MWAHKPWVGRFIGKGTELADYATWCNAVEGNTTFYATPSAATVRRWAEQAPADFRFAFKVPRTVTHDQRLRSSAHRDVAEFLRAVEPLGERVGPVQLQLPPSFGPESLGQVGTFVTGLPTSYRWVIELRHPAFFDDGAAHRAIDEILRKAGVGRVVLDTRPLYASAADTEAAVEERRTKPRVPIVTDVMGEEPIVRVIAGNDVGLAAAGLVAWTDQVIELLQAGRRPYVFAHQPDNGESPLLARRFHAAIAERVPGLAPLPEPTTIDTSSGTDQTSLF